MKNIFLSAFVLLMFMLFFVGCDQNSITNSAVVEEDGIEYYLQTDNYIYTLGDTVEILYRVTNKTLHVKNLGEVPNCNYCKHEAYITYDEEETWRSCRIIPPCGFIDFILKPKKSWQYEFVWDMTNDNGTFEPGDDFPITFTGTYDVGVELRIDGGGARAPLSLTIDII